MGAAVFIPLGAFAMIAVVVALVVRGMVARSEHRLQAHSRMLDRFGDSAEFVSFLQTAEGRRYLDMVSAGAKRSQKVKMLGSIRTGVILVILSTGLMASSFLMRFHDPVAEPPFIFGFLGMFLGIGFLASAAVSYWIAKAWKMENGEAEHA